MYGKIFESMYRGSLYGQWEAIVTFQQMIVLADKEGFIDITPHALAATTSIPIDIISKGIEVLEGEDPYSRTDNEGGRRILRLNKDRPWGWKIVNYEKYRDMASEEERREYMRDYMRKYRKQGKFTSKHPVNDCKYELAELTHTDTDTDTNTDIVSSSNEEDTAPISKNSNCPYQKIIDIYHNKLPELPKVQDLSDKLKSRIKARWKSDKQRQNLKWWEWYFEGVSECDYLVGKVKDWAANFYWLTGPENMTKVLNGQYVNRGTPSKTDQAVEDFLNED